MRLSYADLIARQILKRRKELILEWDNRTGGGQRLIKIEAAYRALSGEEPPALTGDTE